MDVIEQLALRHNTTSEQMRSDMVDAILAAKDSDGFKAMFGEGCIPSPETFILTVAVKLREQCRSLQ